MSRLETATSLFKQGYDCAQTVLVAFGDVTGIERETALKLGSAFAGGMGMTGNTCGTVSGALMVIGLVHGATEPKDKETKARTIKMVNDFFKKFNERNASATCRELIGVDIASVKQMPSEERKNVYRKCLKYVQSSVEILEEIL
jgi:C_GCAxxG_C_C family probable redox protein